MDNPSENDINETSQPLPDSENSGLNVDSISGKIKEALSLNNDVSADSSGDPFLQLQDGAHVPLPDIHVETTVKKYVIHVDPENVDYMEHLTVNERRQLINNILKEQAFLTKEEMRAAKVKKGIVHTLIVIFTFSIFFPLLFIVVTSAAKLTMTNYSNTKSSISKLYKDNGVIKRKD